MNKRCFKCKLIKSVTEFYRHKGMADGYLGKCKACTKQDTKDSREQRPTQYANYEKERAQRPNRKAKALVYKKTGRDRNPHKARARVMVQRAVASGRLTRKPCVHCGDPEAEAHHKDYFKPLCVTWVCFKCHREIEHNQTCH